MSAKIESLNLTIGKKKLELSLDEAKELHHVLDQMFKTKEFNYPPPYYPPIQDQWWEIPPTTVTYGDKPPVVYCSDSISLSIQ
jgi:hypothetical protein